MEWARSEGGQHQCLDGGPVGGRLDVNAQDRSFGGGVGHGART